MRLVSFSLWGDRAKYNVGAIRNAYLVKQYYPGWMARFYIHEKTNSSVIEEIRSAGAEVIMMRGAVDWKALLWRFGAVGDKEVQVMISRDCDSRIYQREVEAVDAWLRSPANLHIMRDHPYHSELILGGMWGAKRPILEQLSLALSRFLESDSENPEYGIDQKFLRTIYFRYIREALVHDELFEAFRWPNQRKELRFVGQVYDEYENTPPDHLAALKYTIRYRQNLSRLASLMKQNDK